MFTNNSLRYVLAIFGLTLYRLTAASDRLGGQRRKGSRLMSLNNEEYTKGVAKGIEMAQEQDAPKAWKAARNNDNTVELGTYLWWSAKRRNGLTKMGKGLAMTVTGAALAGLSAVSCGLLSAAHNQKALQMIKGEEELIQYTFLGTEKNKVLVKLTRMDFYEINNKVIIQKKTSKKIQYAELKKFKKLTQKAGDIKKTDCVTFKLDSLKGRLYRMCDRNIYFNKPVLCDGKEYDFRHEFYKQFDVSVVNAENKEGARPDGIMAPVNQMHKFVNELEATFDTDVHKKRFMYDKMAADNKRMPGRYNPAAQWHANRTCKTEIYLDNQGNKYEL